MDHHPHPDSHLTARHPSIPAIERLTAIMHRLRAPGGCPWDAAQSHPSLIPNLIEEAHEVADAIRRGHDPDLCEELGDLLLQVVFHAELGSERGAFGLDEIAHGISDKLIRRHPHVFGDAAGDSGPGGMTADAVLTQWDAIKRHEKGQQAEPYLHGTGRGLPALLRAAKLQKKAAKTGFDWPQAADVLEKLREEAAELEEAMMAFDPTASGGTPVVPAIEHEIGDLLFTVVNLARKLGTDPEAALDAANSRFANRFHAVEEQLREAGLALSAENRQAMEDAWVAAKEAERTGPLRA